MNATNTDLVFETICRNVIQRQPKIDAQRATNIKNKK